jgi:hypothetical protein
VLETVGKKTSTCRWWRVSLVAAFLSISAQANAQSDLTDLPWRSQRHYETHVVAADGTEVATYSLASKVLKDTALQSMKQMTVHHSKGAQKLQILEAYTRKADGRRVNAPKDNFQVRVDSGQGSGNPAFSDLSSTTVVFPDVAVGDSVVVSYKLSTTQAWFPGKISFLGTFPKAVAYDDVRIVVDTPSQLPAKYAARGMTEKVVVKNGRKRVEWSLQNKVPTKNDRQDFSVYDIDSEPGYVYSTFDSYGDIALNYDQRATPKAAVTARIRKLADELTQGKTEPADQARSLYDWVTTTITYAGNCVALGAVVPRDLDVVLDNKMGDCKDHATLLQALLAAKGIASHQALVNAGTHFRLPEIPVASLVNHVINFVPSLNLFLDSTDPDMPFGHLPLMVQDKPVLMADASLQGKRTPADRLGTNTQVMKTILTLKDDGSAEGRVEVSLGGNHGINARRRFKGVSRDDEKSIVKSVFRGMGLEGDGTVVLGDHRVLSDSYTYAASFKAKDVVPFPGSGAFYVSPMFYSEAPIWLFAQQASVPSGEFPGLCTSGTSSEEFEITLPQQMQVLSIPDSTAFNSPLVAYEASYQLDGRVLKVRRKLTDKTPGNVCSPETLRTYREALAPVLKNLRQQVLYK